MAPSSSAYAEMADHAWQCVTGVRVGGSLAGIVSRLVLSAAGGLLPVAARRRAMQFGLATVVRGVSYFGVSACFTMAGFHYSN